MKHDKIIETERYNARAKQQIVDGSVVSGASLGSQKIPAYLRTPYEIYERNIAALLQPNHRVLELGAGEGLHTLALLRTGAQVVASDISQDSLFLLQQRLQTANFNLKTEVADMECLPFADSSFDVIVSAGSLSYGDPQVVNTEIKRLLRRGGILICVDSLNHNPFYRLNRWIHFIRGNRSKSTLKRMPDLARITALSEGFSSVNVHFFGSMSYAMPVIARLFGENISRAASDRIDQLVGVRRSAFKFVIVAQGFA